MLLSKVHEVDPTLHTMLQKHLEERWADWVWDEDFIKPSLAVLLEYAYTHKHMPGVQSAAETVGSLTRRDTSKPCSCTN